MLPPPSRGRAALAVDAHTGLEGPDGRKTWQHVAAFCRNAEAFRRYLSALARPPFAIFEAGIVGLRPVAMGRWVLEEGCAVAKAKAAKAAKKGSAPTYVFALKARTDGNASMRNTLGGKGANLPKWLS